MNSALFFMLGAFVVSCVCGFIFIPLIMNFCQRNNLYDIPNSRKEHHNPVPRLGGICFLPSSLLAFIIALSVFDRVTGKEQIVIGVWTCMFCISLLLIYGVGLVDDIVSVSPRTKFIVQIVAASLIPLSGLYINNLYGFMGIHELPYWVGVLLTVFIFVFIDNAINLIDGIDGLAGSLSLIAFGGFLYCFAKEGLWVYCIMIAGLMGVLVSYLYFNIWGKAEKNRKIFMGDSGSLSLGFILAFLLVKYSMDNPNVMPYRKDCLLLSYTLLVVPVFDVVRVIFKRLKLRKPLFHADKNHVHHKLMRAGLSQRGALNVIIVLALFFVAFNYLLADYIRITYIALIDVLLYTLFHLVVNRFIRFAGEK